jgi:tripartite-type tricarboxylate transporter receptor subunit TctC
MSIALGALALAAPAAAEDKYPSKPVRFIIGQPPGGATDTFGRAVADGLSRIWGQPTIVENKTGANTIVSAEYVVRSAPDGYTIWVASDGGYVNNVFLYSKLSFDPRKDMTPITRLVNVHQLLVAPASLPANNVKEFIALMKKDGSKYNYASPGVGDGGHINFEWFKTVAGFEMTHIPYKGTPPAMQGLLAGDAHAFLGSALSMDQYIKTGKIKPIVVSGSVRTSKYPDVGTLDEAGLSNVSFGFWLALAAPAGTPPAVVKKIADDTRKVMSDPAFRAKYVEPFGFNTVNDSPDEFAAFLKTAFTEAEKKVKASGAKLD